MSREVEGKAKTTGGIARTGTFTEATESKRTWSPPCRLASETVEIKSLNTSEAEQVLEETVDLQPDEQVTHDCSTKAEAFDHLYRSVASPSVMDCPRTDASTQTEEFDYLFTHSSTNKPFNQNYFRDDNAKVSFYTGLPTYEVLGATFIHVSPFVKRRTQCLSVFQEMTMVL